MAKLSTLLNQARSKFASTGGALVQQMETIATGRAIPKVVLTSVGMQLRPLVIQELKAEYSRSGLQTRTGELLAAIGQAEVVVTPSVVVALMPRGKGKQFYRKAMALQHGAIHGTGGAKLSARLKKKLLATPGATSVTKAYRYFQLSPAAAGRIRARYDELLKAKGY